MGGGLRGLHGILDDIASGSGSGGGNRLAQSQLLQLAQRQALRDSEAAAATRCSDHMHRSGPALQQSEFTLTVRLVTRCSDHMHTRGPALQKSSLTSTVCLVTRCSNHMHAAVLLLSNPIYIGCMLGDYALGFRE